MKNGKKLFVAFVILVSSAVSGWALTPQDPIDPDSSPTCRKVDVTVKGGSSYTCYCNIPQDCTPPRGLKECSANICLVQTPTTTSVIGPLEEISD